MKEKEAFIILNALPDIGPVKIKRLLNKFGSAREAVAQCGEGAEGIGPADMNNIKNWSHHIDIRRESAFIEKHKISVITIADSIYPALLKEIYDPPAVLYIKGDPDILSRRSVAVVGARAASFYGISTARRLARELAARGFNIVSGLARGVDTAAHEGSLQAKGVTTAVFGCGLGTVYPPENRRIAERIAEEGALISEFPFSVSPLRQNFPRRNRIISGLSSGVIVVEAGRHSGSLITARLAAEQGRDVFSVPGRIDTAASRGSNMLIKEGARPVMDIGDVLEELGFEGGTPECVKEKDSLSVKLNEREDRIYKVLDKDPLTVDDIVNKTKTAVNNVWTDLVGLELKGLAKRLPGGMFVRKG